MASGLPLAIFPGFTGYGLVSPAVIELATVFNAEGVEALQVIPDEMLAWANIGTRVTPGVNLGQAKIPVRLTSLLGFEPFEGSRKYHQLTVATVAVRVQAQQLNLEWPIQLSQGGNAAGLADYYGVSGVANDVVYHARANKADMVASVIIGGQTNSSLSMTASAYTLPQPGLSSGLPLFSDGSSSGSTTHYSNPLDGNSKQFANLYLNAGKLTDSGVMAKVMTDMIQVPHPSKKDMTMGLQVTDIIGGTAMTPVFQQLATQMLSLQTVTSPGNIGVASTNIFNQKLLQDVQSMVGPNGLRPWRFWIAPQLDSHPYLVAHPTYQMWISISNTPGRNGAWCEMAAPTKEFTPKITMMGDGTEMAIETRKIHLMGDLDAGAAAGLPHFVKMYYETTP